MFKVNIRFITIKMPDKFQVVRIYESTNSNKMNIL